MEGAGGMAPLWQRKFSEGKMFDRFVCDRCSARFNFAQSPRVTRIPHCPGCGSPSVHTSAA